MKTSLSRAIFGAAALAVFTAAPLVSGALPALAHGGDCPYCDASVTGNTPTQDNQTVLKLGKQSIAYKCVYCAVADAKTEHKGDLSISAPSEKKGRPVIVKRLGDKWSAVPASAVFVMPSGKLKHRICQQQSRAFNTRNAATAYAKANGSQVVTLSQLVAQAN